MSDRTRGDAETAVLVGSVVALFLLLSMMVYSVAVSHTERKLRAQSNASAQQERTDAEIHDACIQADPTLIAACIEQKIKASEEAQRDEYDLSAQQDMAAWAMWMVWISIGSVAVGSAGIFFVWKSLEQGRAAVSATVETGIRQMRPWLLCNDATLRMAGRVLVEDKGRKDGLVFFAKLENVGPSPGVNMSSFGDYSVVPIFDDVPTFERGEMTGNAVVAPRSPGRPRTHFLYGASLDLVMTQQAAIIIYIYVRYEDPVERGRTYVTETTLRCVYDGTQQNPGQEPHHKWLISTEGPQNQAI